MAVEYDLLTVVETFEDAANRHAIDEIMAMFSDDAEFELVGLARLVGKKEIRAIFEYDAGVKGEIQLINCTAKAATVSCRLVERNDRLRAAGLDKLLYPSCVLSFTNKLIRSWRAVPDPEPARTLDLFWGAVRLWIAEHYPVDYARIFTPEGRFIRNRDNGERAVQLAREYRSRGYESRVLNSESGYPIHQPRFDTLFLFSSPAAGTQYFHETGVRET